MQLSSVLKGGIININGKRAIVTSRDPEDRSSGITRVMFDGGGSQTFIWDHENPEVEYLGQGTVEVKIVPDSK